MEKLKISVLLKETGAFVLTYSQGVLFNKEGEPLQNKEKQAQFSRLIKEFGDEKRMFDFLSNARKHLNSPKPSVGFFVKEEGENVIKVTRLYFIIGICMSMVPMEDINYKLFFEEFFDLEGRDIVVEDPKS